MWSTYLFLINGVYVQSYTDEEGQYMLEAAKLLMALGLEKALAEAVCNNPFSTYSTFQRFGIEPYLIYVKWAFPQVLNHLVRLEYITLDQSMAFIDLVRHAQPIIAADRSASPVQVL